MIEQALHLTSGDRLRAASLRGFDRLYWGAEFCQNLIPGVAQTRAALARAAANKVAFTLVTPFVTEAGLERVRELLCLLAVRQRGCEVVANDWGVLQCLRTDFAGCFVPVLGRLLVRQQRDPGIVQVLHKQPVLAVRGKNGRIFVMVHKVPDRRYRLGVQSSYVNTACFQRVLSAYGVARVEMNNLLQGVNLRGIRLKRSLYTPLVNISTTRCCPMETAYQRRWRINVCARECRGYYSVLTNQALQVKLYMRGNTTFYRNPADAAAAEQAGFDRLVVQDILPAG